MAASSSSFSLPDNTDKAEQAFTELRTFDIYHFRNTHCQLQVLRSNLYNKIYIGFHKYANFVDATTKEVKFTHNFVNFPLVAVDELIKCLADVRDFAKSQQGESIFYDY